MSKADSMRMLRSALLNTTDPVGVHYEGADAWVTDRYVLFRAGSIMPTTLSALGAAESGWYRAAASGMQAAPDRHGWDTAAITALAHRIEDPAVTWVPLTLTQWAVVRSDSELGPARLLTGPDGLHWADADLLERWERMFAPRTLTVEVASRQPRMPLRVSVTTPRATWATPAPGNPVPPMSVKGYIMPVSITHVPDMPELLRRPATAGV